MSEITSLSDGFNWEEVWPEMAERYRQIRQNGDASRLQFALELAEREYHDPACETAGSKMERRSFCFTHQKITRKSVLLIHGWSACPFEMRELGGELYHQGYNVFGVRLAGHGTSVVDFARTGAADWENSTRRGLAVAALLGNETVVVGESMGGALAVLLAQAYPALVQRLVLCAPCFQMKDFRSRFVGMSLVQQMIPYYDSGLQYGWQYDYWYDAIPIKAVAELAKVAHDARRAGAVIIAPTLIIQAENDQLVNSQAALRFYHSLTWLTPEQKELILFPDGHHNLTVSLNPRKNEVFEWIRDFVRR